MCGLIAVKNLKNDIPVNQIVRTLYEGQKARGTEGFGFVGLTKSNIITHRATQEKDIVEYLDNKDFDEILFHHRYPTSTDNTLPTTHPFEIEIESKGKKYYFAHNGVISNDDELYDKHKKLGIKYKSFDKKSKKFNDSESLAWEFCLWINGMIDKFEARGSVALLCIELDSNKRAKRLYFYRNKVASLNLFRTKNYLQISSEGCGDEVKANRVYYYDYKDKQIRKFKSLTISSYYYDDFDEKLEKEFEDELEEEFISGCYGQKHKVIPNTTYQKKLQLPIVSKDDILIEDEDEDDILDQDNVNNSIFRLEDLLIGFEDEHEIYVKYGHIDEAITTANDIDYIRSLLDRFRRIFSYININVESKVKIMKEIKGLLEYID